MAGAIPGQVVIDLAIFGEQVVFQIIQNWINGQHANGELSDAEAEKLHANNRRDFASSTYKTDDQVPVSEGGTMPDPADTTPSGGQ